jgi:hyperosmotically inducible protein
MVLLIGSAASAQAPKPASDPLARAQGGLPADAERARAIEAVMQKDPVLRDDRVAIEVTGKHVRLSGIVDTDEERSHAEEVVRQSDPTLTVENLLKTNAAPPPGETKTESVEHEVKDNTDRAIHKTEKVVDEAGEMVSDGWITSKIKAQLMAADGVHASAINVDTSDHVVTLRGQVRSEGERRKAEKLARETKGVDKVVDQLTITTRD